jgi:hypothetical protein
MNAREAILIICQAKLSRAGTYPFATVSNRETYRDWTHTKRQATQRSCLPSLLGDGDKGIEIVYGEEKKIFCTGPPRAAKTEQKA